MRHVLVVAAFAALLGPSMAQQTRAKVGGEPSEAYKKLDADYAAEAAKYSAALKKIIATQEYKDAVEARDREAIERLRGSVPKIDYAAFAERAMKEAEKASGNEQARFLTWMLEHYAPSPQAVKAIDLLVAKHANTPAFADFVQSSGFVYGHYFARHDPEKAPEWMKAIRENARSDSVNAWTYYAEATAIRGRELSDDQKQRKEQLLAEAKKLADGELLDRINAPDFEKEHLQIGMVAPEIEGEDLDGRPIRLSDYRGKVVVLDFWGDW